jgi:cob(I)alamin adenosyltransferase
MAVHLTRIIPGPAMTDHGLSDFSRVSKSDARLAAYADCDEDERRHRCARGDWAARRADAQGAAADPERPLRCGRRPVHPVVENPNIPAAHQQSYIDRLECGATNSTSHYRPEFVCAARRYPLSALLHVARTVARRARTLGMAGGRRSRDSSAYCRRKYLNRLSDLLFILSRVANPDGDVLWKPGGQR